MSEKPFEQMTEAEQAEHFYDNRHEYEEQAKAAEPVQLDRVVSTRFSPAELRQVVDAAKRAGLPMSTFIRQTVVAALAAETATETAPAIAFDPEGLAKVAADLREALNLVEAAESRPRVRVNRTRTPQTTT